MCGGDSARRARLSWPSIKALWTHPHIKTFWRTRCCRPRKGGLKTKREGGNSNKTRLSHSTTDWLEQHEVGVEVGRDDINPIENLWAILDERLESKSFALRN